MLSRNQSKPTVARRCVTQDFGGFLCAQRVVDTVVHATNQQSATRFDAVDLRHFADHRLHHPTPVVTTLMWCRLRRLAPVLNRVRLLRYGWHRWYNRNRLLRLRRLLRHQLGFLYRYGLTSYHTAREKHRQRGSRCIVIHPVYQDSPLIDKGKV